MSDEGPMLSYATMGVILVVSTGTGEDYLFKCVCVSQLVLYIKVTCKIALYVGCTISLSVCVFR